MRPLSIGDTLDQAIALARSRWRTLVLLVLAVLGPVQAAGLIADLTSAGPYAVSPLMVRGGQTGFTAGVVVTLVQALATLPVTLACYHVLAEARDGREVGIAEALAFGFRRLLSGLVLYLLLGLGILAALVAFVVPGIWLAVAWSVAVPAFAIEDRRAGAALARSFELVKGRWWTTAGLLVTAFVLVYVLDLVVSVPCTVVPLLAAGSHSAVAVAGARIGGLLGSAITTPLMAAVTLVLFFELRAGKERLPAGQPQELPPPGPLFPPPEAPRGTWLPPVPPPAPDSP